ncbi:hypothetical protein [Xanthomonas arboricola]|uniref:hypothetical protein n=1 Tax=Xanthomonas arboricola TaxID=56448 RepID=UPI00208E0CBD|nr:hypothetical protein [Xanthomonas arboricola]
MKKKRPKSPPPAPAPAASRIHEWIIGGGAVVVAIACCMRLWLVLEAIVTGRYISVIRGRPTKIFYADADPQRFWIAVCWDALLTSVPLAIIAWFTYVAWTTYRRGRR